MTYLMNSDPPSNGRNGVQGQLSTLQKLWILTPKFNTVGTEQLFLNYLNFRAKKEADDQKKTWFFFKWIFVPLSNKLIVMSHIHRIFYSNRSFFSFFSSQTEIIYNFVVTKKRSLIFSFQQGLKSQKQSFESAGWG